MNAFLARRYTVSARDDRYSFFHYESTDRSVDKKFGIVCVERATGKEIGTHWVNQRDPNVIVDPALRTVYLQEKDNSTIRAVRF